MPIGVEIVSSSMPGSIGWWKWKSCSPWRIAPSSSCGITDSAAMPIAWNAGTIENTGGASSPEACCGIASLVAAAYAAIRSRSTVNATGSPGLPIASDLKAGGVVSVVNAIPFDRCVGPRA